MTFDRMLNLLALAPAFGRAALRRAAVVAGLGLGLAGAAHAQLVITGIPDSPDPVAAGGTVTYTVGIGDATGLARSNVTLNFDVPAGGRYAGTGTLPAGASCAGMALNQAGPGTLTCTGINVPAQATVQLPIKLRTTAAGTLTVTGTVVGGSSQSETTTVDTGADLQLALSAPATAAAGSTQNVRLTVTNNGPGTANNVVINDPLPSGAYLTWSTTSVGCSITGTGASQALSCTVATLSGAIGSLNRTSIVACRGTEEAPGTGVVATT